MKTEILKKAGNVAIKAGMKIRKVSPELMLAGGIVAGVAAIVTACIATKKVIQDPEIQKSKEEIDRIANGDVSSWKKVNDDGTEEELTKKEIVGQKVKICANYIWKYLKAFGLPAFLCVLSVGLILGSHGILKKRYVSTTLAYKALDEAFKDYRKRVQEAVGVDKEMHFFNGTEEGGEVTVINEDGTAVTTKDAVKTHDKKYSPYEFDFNSHTAPGNWEANSDYNLMFLRNAENYLNDLLNSRGHVFLNEALDALGLKRTREGAVVGWVKGSGGDDYVDLGFADYYTDEYCDAHDGYLKNIHLNFNVDGVIWNKI